MATLLIGADICPIGVNQASFASGDAESLLHDLLDEFRQADLAIVNLECPLIERPSPILKTGPTFGEPGACIRGIQKAGIDVVGLANNHILDHGDEGLRNTMRVCAEAGVATVGAGENLQAARRILVRDLGGVRVGIAAMAEHEFSIATDASWGANPLDVIEFARTVREHRGEFDRLIVLVHGGFEFYPYPSPRIRKTCRFLVDLGATAVFVQHAHCLGGYEAYGGGLIFYGQGAVVMDEAIYRTRESFHEAYLVKLTLAGTSEPAMELIPLRQSAGRPGARKLAGEEAERLLKELAEKSKAIQDDAFVRDRWVEFCMAHRHGYMSTLLGHGRVLRKLNAGGHVESLLHGKSTLLGTRNVVCCEAHREVLETLFLNNLM
jgi:poly-gamma-glutamate capsule biosynthesis protein CapA/YwtB (metallophosphatase superfamily)